MKIIKGILITIITIILSLLITVLVFSLNMKHVINEEILNKLVKEEVTNQTIQIFKDELGNITDEEISNVKDIINNNEKFDVIVDKYIDDALLVLADENVNSTVDFKEDLKTIVTENKNILEEEFNIKISDSELEIAIEEVDKELNLNEEYNKIIQDVRNNLGEEGKTIFRVYNLLISDDFVTFVIIGILVSVLLIGLFKMSFYKWLLNLSISSFIASILTLISSVGLGLIINMALEELNENIRVNITNLLISCLIIFVSAIVMLIIYFIIKKKTDNKLVEE